MHVRSYMKQLLSGVHYMHVNKILHRDIKGAAVVWRRKAWFMIGANLLITRGNVLKIADWGLARSFYTSTQRYAYSHAMLNCEMLMILVSPTLWWRCGIAAQSCFWRRENTVRRSTCGVWGEFWGCIATSHLCLTRCIFGELLKRKAILPGRNEVEQLDLIYRLLGTPTGAALDRLKRCEGWEKMKVAETYTPSLREKFRSYVFATRNHNDVA